MATQLEVARNRLFDSDGLNARNIKLYPGANRDATAEEIAKEINQSLTRLEAGSTGAVEED